MKPIILRHLHVLQLHQTWMDKPITSLKTQRDLKDSFVHAEQKPPVTNYGVDSLPPPTGHQPRGHCSVCPLSKCIKDLHNPVTAKTLTLSTFTTGGSCLKLCIGKIQHSLCSHLIEHKHTINTKDASCTLIHFIQDLKFWVTELITVSSRGGDLDWSQANRMFILGTVSPYGLNEEVDLSCYSYTSRIVCVYIHFDCPYHLPLSHLH